MRMIQLHNLAWYLRLLGWVLIYFYYIAELEERPQGKIRCAAAFVCCYAADIWIYQEELYFALELLLIFFGRIFAVFFCKKADWKTILFGVCTYVIVYNFCGTIYELCEFYFFDSFLTFWSVTQKSYFLCAASLLAGFLLIRLVKRQDVFHEKKRLPFKHMVLLLFPVLIYFMIRELQLRLMREPEIYSAGRLWQFQIILVLLTVCTLASSILTHTILSEIAMQEELKEMERLFEQQRQNYQTKIAAENTLHQKYHDLKNSLLALKAEGGSESEVKKDFIHELEMVLEPIDAEVDFGNEFLNIVLREKLVLCQNKKIRLTPYIDGSCLNFMDGVDICVLVGNLLDNAIRAAEKLPEEKREIRVRIAPSGKMTSLHFENPFEGTLHFQKNGLPETTKEGTGHGYGLRSAKQIADKYQGTLILRVERELFMADALVMSG